MIPILTGVVVVIPLLFMGSLIMESFFGIPGLGSYTIDAIQSQDFAVVRAMVFLGSVLYIVGLMLTDHFLYAGRSPRAPRVARCAFMPVMLWTDALLWLLVAATLAYLWLAPGGRISPRPGCAWRAAAPAMVSLLLLAGYGAIGLADSLHFRVALPATAAGEARAYSPATSVAARSGARAPAAKRGDDLLGAARDAPFRARGSGLPDGKPAARVPAAALRRRGARERSRVGPDVARRALAGLAGAALAVAAARRAALAVAPARPQVPWGAAYATLGAMLALAGPGFALSLAYHVLGTDKVGQDVLYLSLK